MADGQEEARLNAVSDEEKTGEEGGDVCDGVEEDRSRRAKVSRMLLEVASMGPTALKQGSVFLTCPGLVSTERVRRRWPKFHGQVP